MKHRFLVLSLSVTLSGHAFSIDLDSLVETPVIYASETVAPSGGAQTTVSESISGAVGFGITANTSRYLRFDLPGSEFIALPSLAIPPQSGSGIEWVGGGVGTNYVIFEVIADATTSIAPSDVVTLSFGAASPNLELDGTTVVATFGHYYSAPGALNQDSQDLLATSSGTLFAFQPGTEVGSTTETTGTTPLKIDVAFSNTRFVGGGTRSSIGGFYAAEIPGDQFLLDGVTDITYAASRTAASKLRVFGDFSATADTMTGDYSSASVFLSSDACASSILDAESLTAGEAVFPVGNTAYGNINVSPSLTTGPDICIEVNGVDIIAETDYTARYEPVATSGYSLPDKSFPLGSLRKNSASDTQNLVLKPRDIGGAYETYVRVTNTSIYSGDVFFRLINDFGESGPQVTLASVLGSASSRLAAAGSTELIDIGRIYAASIAADPSWSIGSEPFSKLRLVTTGDFTSIDVIFIAISQDQTRFNTF